jgi:hypothetical protein
MRGKWIGVDLPSAAVDHLILQSLSLFPVSGMERLTVSGYNVPPPKKVENSPVYLTLHPMGDIRTLVLIECLNLPFILALNPKKNPTQTVLCPELEKLEIHIGKKGQFCIGELLEMAKERATEGVRLEDITIISPQEFVPTKEVLKLRIHVQRVEYKLDDVKPSWDTDSDSDDAGYDSDWCTW